MCFLPWQCITRCPIYALCDNTFPKESGHFLHIVKCKESLNDGFADDGYVANDLYEHWMRDLASQESLQLHALLVVFMMSHSLYSAQNHLQFLFSLSSHTSKRRWVFYAPFLQSLLQFSCRKRYFGNLSLTFLVNMMSITKWSKVFITFAFLNHLLLVNEQAMRDPSPFKSWHRYAPEFFYFNNCVLFTQLDIFLHMHCSLQSTNQVAGSCTMKIF